LSTGVAVKNFACDCAQVKQQSADESHELSSKNAARGNIMKSSAIYVATLLAASTAWAQPPAILLEACNQMEPAAKRLECLRAASGIAASGTTASTAGRTTGAQSLYSASAAAPRHVTSSGTTKPVGGQTCYVGPRGGTYTITASGRKNYSGC
jgi:hypothetical protein